MFTKKNFILICLAALLVGAFAEVSTSAVKPAKDAPEIAEEATETVTEVKTDVEIDYTTESNAVESTTSNVVA